MDDYNHHTNPAREGDRGIECAAPVEPNGKGAGEVEAAATDPAGEDRERRSKVRLTKGYLTALLKEGTSVRRHWDADLPGFYLEVTPKGTASYRLRYPRLDGSKNDVTVGRASVLAPDQAREAARAMLASLTLNGVDPGSLKPLGSMRRVPAMSERSLHSLNVLCAVIRGTPTVRRPTRFIPSTVMCFR